MGARETPIGAVVVGTGFGCLTHVSALSSAGIEVRALVGRNPDRTRTRADRFGIPHALLALTDALQLPGVDVVSVATPPHTHADLVLEAVAAGRHVVCEKPFARDAAEARAMLDAADAAGVVHLPGMEFRFAMSQALLTRIVREGCVGDPVLATLLLDLPLLADPASEIPGWWSDASQGGGVARCTRLPRHRPDSRDPRRIQRGERDPDGRCPRSATAEDSYTVHFRLVSGVEGIMSSSAATWGPPLVATRVVGTTGTAWLEGDDVWIGHSTGNRPVPVPDDLVNPPPDPPPADLMVTTYDLMHATGIDLAPYTRLYRALQAQVTGEPVPNDSAPATFADGVAGMVVEDAPFLGHTGVIVQRRTGGQLGQWYRTTFAERAVATKGVNAVLGFDSIIRPGLELDVVVLEGDPVREHGAPQGIQPPPPRRRCRVRCAILDHQSATVSMGRRLSYLGSSEDGLVRIGIDSGIIGLDSDRWKGASWDSAPGKVTPRSLGCCTSTTRTSIVVGGRSWDSSSSGRHTRSAIRGMRTGTAPKPVPPRWPTIFAGRSVCMTVYPGCSTH
jgi:predicted dehydrogenase